jgi:hypothetical protein
MPWPPTMSMLNALTLTPKRPQRCVISSSRISPKFNFVCQRAGVRTVRCAVIGSKCTKIHFVHVPIDHGCEGNARAEDLKYEQYLDVESSINGFVVDLDDIIVEYDSYPRFGMVNSFRWTVFSSDHVSHLAGLYLNFCQSHSFSLAPGQSQQSNSDVLRCGRPHR